MDVHSERFSERANCWRDCRNAANLKGNGGLHDVWLPSSTDSVVRARPGVYKAWLTVRYHGRIMFES